MNAYYSHPEVRQRLLEFAGSEPHSGPTALYLTQADSSRYDPKGLHVPAELNWFLERTADIARSLADRDSCLLHLDIEYVNFDSPAAAFLDPWRAFELQEPVVGVIEGLLLQWGIQPLHIITGQGHHFVWRIRKASSLAARLIDLCPAPELSESCLARTPPLLAGVYHQDEQDMFAAAALMIEYLAHRIKELAAPLAEVPVEVTAVHVGPARTQRREMISIDISEYGDPLHTRMIRMPFTYYLKPWAGGMAQYLGIENELPVVWTLPLHEMDYHLALKVRQVEADMVDLARRACVRIPLQEDGTAALLAEYLDSRLRRFHEYFYSAHHDPRERWPETYAHTDLHVLPPCARHLLEHPNDLLLKPAGMQLVTRALLAAGWHPRHIAGLVRSKFEDAGFGWGVDWNIYDAATRADFYVRLFAGLHLTGIDELMDYNCVSTQEKGFCFPDGGGPCSLEPARQRLLKSLSV
jgi:hypothetical protein